MTTRSAKAVLSRLNLKFEAVFVAVASDGLYLIMIDDLYQLNEKYVEVICKVLLRPGETTGGGSNTSEIG